ncbi:MAG: 30S ribosomal protein S9 [Candidatus Micrarchaeota archaeon]|nr:30S ribosomal protein S9 [Candidatus Micrarchaeota archaeon]
MATAKKAKPKEEKPKQEAKEEVKEIKEPAKEIKEEIKEVKEPIKEAKEPAKEAEKAHIAHAPAHAHEEAHAHAKKEDAHIHEIAHAHPKKEEAHAEKPAKPEKAEKKVHIAKTRHSKKAKLTLSKGKRKRAIARVIIQQGKGIIRINKVLLDAMPTKYYRQLIQEVILITGPRINEVNIDALVTGGGISGQMQAVRTAIASGLIDYFNDESLARAFEEHGGRTMIVNDTRRVEPKKYQGPKARARYQKSYR